MGRRESEDSSRDRSGVQGGSITPRIGRTTPRLGGCMEEPASTNEQLVAAVQAALEDGGKVDVRGHGLPSVCGSFAGNGRGTSNRGRKSG